MTSESGDVLRSLCSLEQRRWPYPYQPMLIGEGTWAPIRPADGQLYRIGTIECSASEDGRESLQVDCLKPPNIPSASMARHFSVIESLPEANKGTLESHSGPVTQSTVSRMTPAVELPERATLTERKDTAGPKNVNPNKVLNVMLSKIFNNKTRFAAYSNLFENYSAEDIYQLLQPCSRDAVEKVCKEAPWDYNSLIGIGGEIESDQAATYLHVMSLKHDPLIWWLYIGQAHDLYKRTVKQHSNSWFRKFHPSLHYSVFQPDSMNDAYVVLAKAPKINPDHDWLFLNLLGMWGALIFQTLKGQDLAEWLPPDVDCPDPGQHLNVALPLCQRKTAEDSHASQLERFAQLRYSEYLWQRQHFWSVVKSWNDLRNSPDPTVRAYYYEVMRNRLNLHAMQHSEIYAEGIELKLHTLHSGNLLRIHGYEIYIPVSIDCSGIKSMRVFMLLSQGDERHPHCHTTHALENDPAKRLALKIKFTNQRGEDEEHWIFSDGDRAVMKVNSIVDKMDQVDKEIIKLTPRRSYTKPDGNPAYTS